MPIVHLEPVPLIFVNIAAWLVIHLGISWGCRKINNSFFENKNAWFRTFPFEEDGVFWEKKLRIREWKDLLPDGTVIAKKGFDKSRLNKSESSYLATFIIETRRAELTHWLLIPPAFLFFLWNPLWAGWVMILYAWAVNIPFIIIQRYNRPRLERIFLRKVATKNKIY